MLLDSWAYPTVGKSQPNRVGRSAADYLHGTKLNNGTGCRVNVSPRVVGFQERLVTVAGPHDSLVKCTLSVVRQIQNDDHLREHLQIVYNRGSLQTADHLHVVAGVSTSQDVSETRSLQVWG